MIRTLIIEDEKKNRLRLIKMIDESFPNIDIIGEAEGVMAGLDKINDLKPDLVLLDIKLVDGDAFELLEKVGDISFKIIFITAYEEYALKAIKFSALDYLLKPVLLENLRSAIAKAESQIMNDLKIQLSTLQLNLSEKKKKTIILKTVNKIYLVEIMEVIRCESDGNYTKIFTRDGQMYMVSNPMKEYEDILVEHGFFRIHKSHIVNLSFIQSLDKEGYVKLKNGISLALARRKKNELLEAISHL
jgi:two-component system LytT family response regulator